HEATERLELMRAEVARVGQSVSAADDALQALRVAEVAASKDRERLEDERTRIAAELEVGALEASGLAGADGEVSGELAAMAARAAEATRRVTDVRAALSARQHALTEWREALALAERMHTEHAVRSTQAAERCRAADAARTVATDA